MPFHLSTYLNGLYMSDCVNIGGVYTNRRMNRSGMTIVPPSGIFNFWVVGFSVNNWRQFVYWRFVADSDDRSPESHPSNNVRLLSLFPERYLQHLVFCTSFLTLTLFSVHISLIYKITQRLIFNFQNDYAKEDDQGKLTTMRSC